MEYKNDKQVLVKEAKDLKLPDFHVYHKPPKVKYATSLLWIMLSIIVFCFTCFSVSYFLKYFDNQPPRIVINISRNQSISKIVDLLKPKDVTTTFQPTLSTNVTREACSRVSNLEKFDCHPTGSVTVEECEKLGCCYQEVLTLHENKNSSAFPPLGIPYCYYPNDYASYHFISYSVEDRFMKIKMERIMPSGFPNDVKYLDLEVFWIDKDILRIKILDSNNQRHEAPLNQPVVTKQFAFSEELFIINFYFNGTLQITRKSTGTSIFETNLNQMVYADQFLQLSTRLPTQYIYGLGERYETLLKSVNWTRTLSFNRDNFPRANIALYGSHPFYVGLENDGNSHGVFLLNSNSMDMVLQPTPALTYRTIGGILDFFVFLGPTPSDVIRQYTDIVAKPFMPPYWSLGFHLCRYNYNSLNNTKTVWQRTRDAGIPFDVQWNDIDYMQDHNDFTYDKVKFEGLAEFVEEVHNVGMHYVTIIDPGITNTEEPGTYQPYDEGVEMDIFVKNSSGDIFVGKVWNPISTVFPDFSHPKAVEYWTRQFQMFHDQIPIDGAWIDMNEPSNFYDGQKNGCENNTLENPPYVPGGIEPLRSKTICMSAKHYNTTHYNEHNLYAFREAIATYKALTNVTSNRPFIISRASFAGQGHWSGHWSGDIGSTWEDMRYSVYDLLKFNLYGMPMMGSDICGFRLNTTVELCARWSALGAFYPFSRNHNDAGQMDQDPVALGDVVVAAAKNTLTTRYKLLPYLYYLFYKSHTEGSTVARPLFFEFPHDAATYTIEEQYLWGPALMIIPALYPGVKTTEAYFPNDIWYDFYTGQKLNASGSKLTLDAPLDSINLALRGGYVIPQQHSNSTTTESRQNEFFLLVGLGGNDTASGELYWDDGVSIGAYEDFSYNLITFHVENNVLSSVLTHGGYDVLMILDYVKVCGLSKSPIVVTLDYDDVPFTFDEYNCLKVNTDISLLQDFILKWA